MSLPRYSEYKDSGVEWLGEVPIHWDIKRIKNTTYLKGRVGWKGLTSDEYLEDGYAYLVTGTDFSDRFIHWNDCHCVERDRYEDDPFIQLRNGDLLITKDGTIGKLALVKNLDRPACLNSGIFLVRPENSYVTEYMYWVLLSRPFSVFCDLSSLGSTIQHLYQNVFERFVFPVPSLEEQQTIATFLDRETGKIDTLIAEQRRLVELLAEKRQAVISHAVTKGLPSTGSGLNAMMKDSGIEWLGEVPEHWEVKKIKHLATRIASGKTPLGGSEVYVDEGVMFLRSQNVYDEGLWLDDVVYISAAVDEIMSVSRVSQYDILLNVTGASIGRSCVVPADFQPANVNQHVCVIRLRMLSHVPYVGWFFKSLPVKNQIDHAQNGAAREGLNFDQIGNMSITFPPANEQQAIVSYLDAEAGKFDALTAEANRAIALLQERRSALISAAVTGKIDVRKLSLKKEAA